MGRGRGTVRVTRIVRAVSSAGRTTVARPGGSGIQKMTAVSGGAPLTDHVLRCHHHI